MAKPYDPRVVDRARPLKVCIDLNVESKHDGDTPPAPSTWMQICVIDYALLDSAGKLLSTRSLTHIAPESADKLTVAQAVGAVRTEIAAWVSADRLALADNDS